MDPGTDGTNTFKWQHPKAQEKKHGDIPRHFDGPRNSFREAVPGGNPDRRSDDSWGAGFWRVGRATRVRIPALARANPRGSPLRGPRRGAPASSRGKPR